MVSATPALTHFPLATHPPRALEPTPLDLARISSARSRRGDAAGLAAAARAFGLPNFEASERDGCIAETLFLALAHASDAGIPDYQNAVFVGLMRRCVRGIVEDRWCARRTAEFFRREMETLSTGPGPEPATITAKPKHHEHQERENAENAENGENAENAGNAGGASPRGRVNPAGAGAASAAVSFSGGSVRAFTLAQTRSLTQYAVTTLLQHHSLLSHIAQHGRRVESSKRHVLAMRPVHPAPLASFETHEAHTARVSKEAKLEEDAEREASLARRAEEERLAALENEAMRRVEAESRRAEVAIRAEEGDPAARAQVVVERIMAGHVGEIVGKVDERLARTERLVEGTLGGAESGAGEAEGARADQSAAPQKQREPKEVRRQGSRSKADGGKDKDRQYAV